MAALLFKVGALAIKQLAKPLASRFQDWVLTHPGPRSKVIAASQALHRWEVYISRGAEGKKSKAFVGAMTEEKSLELAAKLASEGFIFGVGVLIVAFEYDRQRRKDILKKAIEQTEREQLMKAAQEERERLTSQNYHHQEMIDQLASRVAHLEEALAKQAEQVVNKAPVPKPMWGGFFGPRGLTAAGP